MMKKLTLIMLTVLFVAVTGYAQGKAAPRQLSQKKQEAVAKLAPKDAKKQLSKKSLQQQTSIDRQKSWRQALTAHWQQQHPGKAFKGPKATKRAAAGIISEQPAGTQHLLSRSGSAYYNFLGYIFNVELSGAVGNVVVNGNDIYVKDLVSQAGMGTWVKGSISGSIATFEFPQVVYDAGDYTISTRIVSYVQEEDGGWFYPSSNQTLTLEYNAATGALTTNPNSKLASGEDLVGLVYDDDNTWAAFGDWNINMEPVDDKLVEAPAGLKTTQYALTSDGNIGTLVNVGFAGNEVYVQGINPDLPYSWIKGTIDGTKAWFKTGQYLGADEKAGYHEYFMSVDAEYLYDEWYGEWYWSYALTDGDVTFTFDPDTKAFSLGSAFLINAGKEDVSYVTAFNQPFITPFTEVAATPATPYGLTLTEGGWDYYKMGYGWGNLTFNQPVEDADGNFILPEKLSYAFWVRVNGEERQVAFDGHDYIYLDETMQEIPFGFNDGWDFSSSGINQYFYYYVIGQESIGVQAIYRGAGEVRKSEIAWLDVMGVGAETQPAAATPAYPDATINDGDNRIDFGYYTGDEDVNAATNNYKTETYDVAVLVKDDAMTGALIESITFPLQQVDGVSGINVFLTSQLRVENGENKPDLVVKGVTPTEAGFITVKLDKPYTIPESGVYVGYSLTIDEVNSVETAMPIAITNKADEHGFFLHTSGGFLKWLNVSEGFGGSSLVQVTLAGSTIKADAVAPASVDKTQYVKTGEAIELPVTFINHGANGIQSFDVDYTVGSQSGTRHFDVSPAVAGFYGKSIEKTLQLPAITEKGSYEVELVVTKVNGQANQDNFPSGSIKLQAINTVPKHRALLEEYTGFWCGYCPRGFAALETLAALYPDDYVLMSYHNGDDLEIMDVDMFPNNVTGFPSAFIDRIQGVDPYYGSSQNTEMGVADDLAARSKVFGMADLAISAALSNDGTEVVISTDVTFPADIADNRYMLNYALLEDGLTDPAWGQSNYYAGGALGYPAYMDEFTTTDQGSIYGLVFNDVVIQMSYTNFIPNTLPVSITADVPVHHDYLFSLAGCYNTAYENIVQDKSKLKVVVMLVDPATGEVLNANVAKVSTNGTGISEKGTVNSDKFAAAAEWFDLQGRKLSAKPTQKGLYIVNGKKVVIK